MFCMKCGKKIDDDSKFCPFCGSPIKGTTQLNEQTQRASAGSQIPNMSALKAVKKPISKNAVIGIVACLVVVLAIVGIVEAFSGGTFKDELDYGLKYEIPKGFSEYISSMGHKSYQYKGSGLYKDFTIYVDETIEGVYDEGESIPTKVSSIPTDELNWDYNDHFDGEGILARCRFSHVYSDGAVVAFRIDITVFSPSFDDRDTKLELARQIADSVDISDLE